MGKGSNRRPKLVDEEEFRKRWDEIFGGGHDGMEAEAEDRGRVGHGGGEGDVQIPVPSRRNGKDKA